MNSLPEFKVIRTICLVALFTVSAASLPLSQLSAVVLNQGTADSESADAGSTQARYQQELEKTRQLAKACRLVSIRFFDTSLAKSYQWKEKWNEAAADLSSQKPIFEKASLDWFFECKQPPPDLIQLAGAIALQATEEGDLELAWKILNKVKQHYSDPDNVDLNMQIALTAIKTNRFEEALSFMRRPDAREAVEGLKHQVDKNMFILCPLLQTKWEREKELRQKEAEQDDLPRVKLQLTTGEVVVELFENEAPETVANFITLVESGFYDGSFCHPVIKGLSMQSGLVYPKRDNNPDYVIKNESRLPQRRSHFTGSLTMSSARDGKDSATSGFGVSLLPNPDLDWNGEETDEVSQPVFGRVISGIEHVFAVTPTVEIDPETQKQKVIRDVEAGAVKAELIEKATVIRKRDHDYTFEKIPRKN